eukprot:jgi/Botrbrau1/20841/Bobra.0156s0066.1
MNSCHYGHGTAGVHPYPGYLHGSNPRICSNGCIPDVGLAKHGHVKETPLQSLTREALEFQDMFHKETRRSFAVAQSRKVEITSHIKATGSYWHTKEELVVGARVAWRNAPKCSNRKFWNELEVIDGRDCQTPEDIYRLCLYLIERAMQSCISKSHAVIFKPQTPGTGDGPRIWNSQLLRFAGYRQPDGSVKGDPAEADFTAMCIDTFGWKSPSGCEGHFDILPLLIQADPHELPQLFEIPPQYVPRVHLRHPTCREFTDLKLQWYGAPAVSNTEMSLGGLLYTAVPFQGWYACTEIVQNLTSPERYDLAPTIAVACGWITKGGAALWRDRVMVEVAVAVMHSFREDGLGIVDHHTLLHTFYKWYQKELKERGYVTGNWKWIVPPMAGTQTACYYGLNQMVEYTLKPGYWRAPGWKKYLQHLGLGHGYASSQCPFDKAPRLPSSQLSKANESALQFGATDVICMPSTTDGRKERLLHPGRRECKRTSGGLGIVDFPIHVDALQCTASPSATCSRACSSRSASRVELVSFEALSETGGKGGRDCPNVQVAQNLVSKMLGKSIRSTAASSDRTAVSTPAADCRVADSASAGTADSAAASTADGASASTPNSAPEGTVDSVSAGTADSAFAKRTKQNVKPKVPRFLVKLFVRVFPRSNKAHAPVGPSAPHALPGGRSRAGSRCIHSTSSGSSTESEHSSVDGDGHVDSSVDSSPLSADTSCETASGTTPQCRNAVIARLRRASSPLFNMLSGGEAVELHNTGSGPSKAGPQVVVSVTADGSSSISSKDQEPQLCVGNDQVPQLSATSSLSRVSMHGRQPKLPASLSPSQHAPQQTETFTDISAWKIRPFRRSRSRRNTNGKKELESMPAASGSGRHGVVQKNQLDSSEQHGPGFEPRCATPAAVSAAEAGQAFGGGRELSSAISSGSGKAKRARVLLLYATVSGVTEEFACRLSRSQEGLLDVRLENMEDVASEDWEWLFADCCVVLVCSSTGGIGSPPRGAAGFIKWLGSNDEGATKALRNMPFAVLGFGDSKYPRFCAAADALHSALAATGAKPLLTPFKADAQQDQEKIGWDWWREVLGVMGYAGLIPPVQPFALTSVYSSSKLNHQHGEARVPHTAFLLVHADNVEIEEAKDPDVLQCPVLGTTSLVGGPTRQVKAVRLDTSNCKNCDYIPGDLVKVYPPNSPEIVGRIVKQLGISSEQLRGKLIMRPGSPTCVDLSEKLAYRKFPLPTTLDTVLTRYLGLSDRLSHTELKSLAAYATDEGLLQALAQDPGFFEEWSAATRANWADALDCFPSLRCKLPLHAFLQIVPTTRPRYYSVSSSPESTPGELALTVSCHVPTPQHPKGPMNLSSSYLTGLHGGETVACTLMSNPSFHRPPNPEVPVFMVAAGSGIAPFRAFWSERVAWAQKGTSLGPATMVFGMQSPTDYSHYIDEMGHAVGLGALHSTLFAYSRHPQKEKTYVQDIIARQGASWKELLEHPQCHIYVAGGAGMGGDVKAAFAQVMGDCLLDQLLDEGRYHQDLFDPARGHTHGKVVWHDHDHDPLLAQ